MGFFNEYEIKETEEIQQMPFVTVNQVVEFRKAALYKINYLEFENKFKPMESAPKDGTKILLAFDNDIVKAWWKEPICESIEGKWGGYGYPKSKEPIGWMPLPKIELSEK